MGRRDEDSGGGQCFKGMAGGRGFRTDGSREHFPAMVDWMMMMMMMMEGLVLRNGVIQL